MAARLHLIGLASAPPSVQFEVIRALEVEEVERINLAISRLKTLSGGSAYQSAVRAMARLQTALEELRVADTESVESRTLRVWTALGELVGLLTQAVDAPLGSLAAPDVLEASESTALLEQLRAMPQWEALSELSVAEPGRVNWYADGSVRISAESIDPLVFDDLVPPVMNKLADGFAAILEEQAELINADSLYLRQLAAEVLFGQPTLVELDPERLPQQQQWQLRELGLQDVERAQAMLRRAKARRQLSLRPTEAVASDGEPTQSDPPHPVTSPDDHAQAGDEGGGASPEARAPDEDVGGADPADSIVFPPVDLEQLAAELGRSATQVETAYGELPKFDEMFAAITKDQQAFGSLLRQVQAALAQVQQDREAAGEEEVTISLPLDSNQIGLLDSVTVEGFQRERQAAIAVLVVLRFLLAAMEGLARPTEFSFRAGQMETYKFTPSVGEHIRQLALTLARVLAQGSRRHGAGVVQGRAWLLDAVDRAIANGLPEGALLYGLGALAATETELRPELLAAARSSIEAFARDGAPPAAEVAIILLGELLPSLQQAANSHAQARAGAQAAENAT
jgi:hypothetical protein